MKKLDDDSPRGSGLFIGSDPLDNNHKRNAGRGDDDGQDGDKGDDDSTDSDGTDTGDTDSTDRGDSKDADGKD